MDGCVELLDAQRDDAGAAAGDGGRARDSGGDRVRIRIDLARVPTEVQRIVIALTLHEAEARHQNFAMVANAFLRIASEAEGREVARYALAGDASTETAMVFGEIYRHNQGWKLRAVGQGFAGGLGPLARGYGVDVAPG